VFIHTNVFFLIVQKNEKKKKKKKKEMLVIKAGSDNRVSLKCFESYMESLFKKDNPIRIASIIQLTGGLRARQVLI